MPIVVELPRLSDTMEEGVIVRWRVAVGDKVKRGQVIAEIETDKATMEFESFDAGTVLKLVATEGEALPLGAPIAVFGSPGEDPDAALVARGAGAKPVAAVAAVVPAPPGTAAAAATAAVVALPDVAASPAPAIATNGRIPASPLARRVAREHDIDLTTVEGTGPHGRVIKADVDAAMQRAPSASAARVAGAATAGADAQGRPFVARPSTLLRHSQMRKTIAKRMTQSMHEAPHFYLTMDIDMEKAAALRGELNEAIKGIKVSFNDILILATARALRDHPEVNAAYTHEGILRHGDVHVGVAVALDDGLVVPVVRFADQKTLTAISIEVRDLGKRAKAKTLDPKEMAGSTFTISNLGMYGIEQFTAVVNPGEGAILAVGGVAEKVVAHEGAMAVRKRMLVTMSSDHRAIDGAVGARFLVTLQSYLEQPVKLFG